jgi:UDP-N-acetylmuramoylalanine--D-glutamate ligase
MKIAILGYGLEGMAALNYFNRSENTITICDQDQDLDKITGLDYQLGPDYLMNLNQFDLIIRSPGVNPALIHASNSDIYKSKITSGTNLFFQLSPTKNIIGVTGTKGKGTTSTLIHKMLLEVGKTSYLAGNIGIPALNLLTENINSDDYIVLEMSSFQLSDCQYSPHIAVCLMITQDHLDWHGQIKHYLASKRNIVSHQSSDDIVVYLASNNQSKALAKTSLAKKIPYMEIPGAIIHGHNLVIEDQVICAVSEIGLLGNHNHENICAAVTCIWQISKDKKAIARVIKNFTGLKNRLELLREKNGIKYYNDSFASAPDAAIAGMKAITIPKVLIIGGFDRNLDLMTLVESIIAEDKKGLIRKLVLIGASADRLAKDLDDQHYTNYQILDAKNVDEITKIATHLAISGDAVILSPGFASFDMFKNFEERGKAFAQAVNKL